MATSSIPDHIAALKKQFLELEQQSVDLLGPVPADLKESTIEIPLEDGFISHSILIRPAFPSPGQSPKKLPLVVLIHGGSFMTCSPKQFLSPGRAVASHLNAVVVSIEYKLAPEHPFPAGPRSAWEVVAWLSKADNLNDAVLRAEGLEVDPALGFVLGGGSAGANLAAVIAGIQASQRRDLVDGLPAIAPDITALFIAIPLLLHDDMVPNEYRALYRSREEHADAPFINTKSLAQTREMYKPDTRSPWFSPVNLDWTEMAGLHPRRVYVQVGERDILRDDGVIYERMLKQNGLAETKLDVMVGYDHACWCNLPFDPAHTQEMKEKTMDALTWLIGKEWDRSRTLSY
ncbi:Alpha/Beta hydrolase protein [Pestalotiopsis sp. NC0098]|nr:Alpha/Beta hydrolase protein [Pestalotiopsis sp. NC0098]